MPTKQSPIHSGFGAATTAREVVNGIDLTGKVAIVSGGYAGIGLDTTHALAEAGATVIAPARTPDKARKALRGVRDYAIDPVAAERLWKLSEELTGAKI